MKAIHRAKTRKVEVTVIGVDNNLEAFLRLAKNTRLDIAVGFASKTEALVDWILKNGNKLTLTVGTINHFSDPVFIKYCREISEKRPSKFDFSVDFRGEDSLHWKIYLVAPSTVVVGSPNLTRTGLTMQRDTAVVIRNRALYEVYRTLLDKIKRSDGVVKCSDSRFEDFLAEYEKQHRKILAKPRPAIIKKRKNAVLGFSSWLNQDTSQILPIFIWDRDLTREERRLFREKIRPKITASLTSAEKEAPGENLYVIGMYDGIKSKPPYESDNVILTMKSTGSYIKFELAKVVIYGAGSWWLCGFERSRVPKPFILTSVLKKAIKEYVNEWAQFNKTFLDSNDLRKLATLPDNP